MRNRILTLLVFVTLASGKNQVTYDHGYQICLRMRFITSHSNALYHNVGAPQFQLYSERIAGGSLAAEGEFPYVASIQISRSHICAGFVYNEKWILTTASCVNG